MLCFVGWFVVDEVVEVLVVGGCVFFGVFDYELYCGCSIWD